MVARVRPDRRRDRTRAALLRAGEALFAARGVEGVSVDEIVQAADVAKGSFYNHFGDKEVFAREIARGVRAEAERLVDAANEDVEDPAAELARALCVFMSFAIDRRDSAQVLWRLNSGVTMMDAPVNRGLRATVQRGLRCGRFRHVDVEAAVLLVIGITVVALRHALEERRATPPMLVGERMASGLLRALGVPARQAASCASRAAGEILGERVGPKRKRTTGTRTTGTRATGTRVTG